MSYRNELPQSGWNLPPGCSDYDIEEAAGSFDEQVSICPGYGSTLPERCGNEKDYDKDLCDECQESADLDARNGEADPDLIYPHLMD